MHSPFVYNFIKNVLNDKKDYAPYATIEELRNQLKQDQRKLTIRDFGAGSKITPYKERSVASIAHTALKPAKYAQLMYRIVQYYHPATIVELGTSLGITTAYLASHPGVQVTTLEGAGEVAAIARENFSRLQLSNIRLVEGNFDETLLPTLEKTGNVDLAFIDGNHRKQPTIDYFNRLLSHVNNYSMLIFDDIHWSTEMEEAWAYIKQHPAVTASIDLFFIGIVLFNKDFKVKQHFTIRF